MHKIIKYKSLIPDYRARRKRCCLAEKGNPLRSASPGGARRDRVWTRLSSSQTETLEGRWIVPGRASYTGYVSLFQRRTWGGEKMNYYLLPTPLYCSLQNLYEGSCVRACTCTHTHTNTHTHTPLWMTAFTGIFTLQVGLLVFNKHTWHLFLDLIRLMKGLPESSEPITVQREMHIFISSW